MHITMQTPPDPNEVSTEIARRIAQFRKSSKLTLKELGKLTSLSEAYLSRVENAEAAVTITGLVNIAGALQVPVSSFFDNTTSEPPFIINRAGSAPKYQFRGKKGNLVQMLATKKTRKLMEPLLVEVSPNPIPLQGHEGEEFNYIISGSCLFRYNNEEQELNEGDSVYFDASKPHSLQAKGSKKCLALAVVSSRDYQYHGNISKVMKPRAV